MSATSELPIACSLEPNALRERLEWIRRLTDQSLIAHRVSGPTLHLTYRPEVLADLERIVAGERACCPFLGFSLEPGEAEVHLTIDAPPSGGLEARWLLEQFLPRPSGTSAPKACGCGPGACA